MCISLARLERENKIDKASVSKAFSRLNLLKESWQQINPSEDLKRKAIRLLRTHNLALADSLQLASAIVLADAAEKQSILFV
jgi:predicted nucleic acid-binding protein